MKNLTLILTVLIFATMLSCNEDEVVFKNPAEESSGNRAQFPDWGWLDPDDDFDLPEIRGVVRIYTPGPCTSNGVPVPCDPVVQVLMPCNYPNGFCVKLYVSGFPSTGGGVPVEKGKIGLLNITLPERELPKQDEVLRKLKADPEVDAENKEELAELIVNTFSFREDSPLAEEVVGYFREQAERPDFDQMIIMAGDYKIHYDDKHPYGYIKAYVKAL